MASRSFRAGELLRDIRAGTEFSALLSKYGLSFSQFHAITSKLVNEGVLHAAELVGKYPLIEPDSCSDSIVCDGYVRRFPRYTIQFPLPIYLVQSPEIRGKIEDISEMGVRIRGIKTKPQEVHIFEIPLNECLQIDSVLFEAICRWSREDYTDSKCIAGHEVLEFKQGSLADLQEWLFAMRQTTE